MPADGKAAWWRVGRLGRADGAFIFLHVSRFTQAAIGLDREHGDGAAKVVRHQHELPRGMDAEMGRAFATGGDRVHQLQLTALWIDGEGADGA